MGTLLQAAVLGGSHVAVSMCVRATCAKEAPIFESPMRAGALSVRLAAPTARSLRTISDAYGLAYQIPDDMDGRPPVRNANGSQRPPHYLNAWYRHRPGTRSSVSSSEIRPRCPWRARAALDRELALTHELPAPLGTELCAPIRRLGAKGNHHPQAGIFSPGSL